MDTMEYNSLDSQQFEKFKSVPDQKITTQKIWGLFALLSIVALTGYLIGTAKRRFNISNQVASKYAETNNHKSNEN